MKHRLVAGIFLLVAINTVTPIFAADDASSLVVMQDDLAELKADFNEAVDQVRLVFIVGPT